MSFPFGILLLRFFDEGELVFANCNKMIDKFYADTNFLDINIKIGKSAP